MLPSLRTVCLPRLSQLQRAPALLAPVRMSFSPGTGRAQPGAACPALTVSGIHTSAVLERARQSTRIKKRKQNLANKKKKEERLRKNPPPLPKKVQLMLKAKGLSAKPKPWRQLDLRPFPTDTAWSERQHSWARLEVSEAVDCLREHCHPTMLNMPNCLVWAKLEFNMANVKKDKYIEGFTKMVPIYHPYERGVAEKHILVFCKTPEEIRLAEEAGAKKAGGSDLVQDILKGKTDVSDYDHFLSTEEMALELKPLLGILRDKFPKKTLGNVSNDIEKLIKTFSHGMLISVKKPARTLGYEEDPSYGSADVTVGRLNQQDKEIEGWVFFLYTNSFHDHFIVGNLAIILETLKEGAPKRATGGFVTRCELYVEGPLKRKFSIHHDLVDDVKYKNYVKSKVSQAPQLETIREESAN